MISEILELDAVGQAEAVATGDVGAVELLEAAISRAARLEPRINAICLDLADEARRTLADRSVPQGPFHGVPFLVKDLFCHMAGTPTAAGWKVLSGNVIDHDSELMKRYRAAGFVTFGKTNVPEMATIGTTEPRLNGPTRNPFALEHTAGGSSGGAAAAVAAGYVAVAHANDGAGSIRIPASCCGLFGLKPSRARVTLGPDIGESIGGISAEHIVSRSVRDSAAVLDLTHGPMSGDPYAAPVPSAPFAVAMKRRSGSLRIAVSTEALFHTEVDPLCRKAVEDAMTLLTDLGHRVVEAKPAIDGERFHRSLTDFWPMSITRAIAALARDRGEDPDRMAAELEPLNRHLYERGRARSAVDYLLDLTFFQTMTRRFGTFFDAYDLWLTPTLTFLPPRLGFFDGAVHGPEEAYRRVIDSFAFTAHANVTGLPAATVPFASSAEGLPIGIQFTARYGDEETLLRIASEIEAARPWASPMARAAAMTEGGA